MEVLPAPVEWVELEAHIVLMLVMMFINWYMIKSASLTRVLIYGLELDTKMESQSIPSSSSSLCSSSPEVKAAGLLMAALNFVLDTPPPLDPDAEPAASFASLTGVDVTRLAMCALWLARASADLRRDVRKFVDGLGEVCDPIQHAGYGWVWWFGPFNGPADGGAPLSLRNARRRALSGPRWT